MNIKLKAISVLLLLMGLMGCGGSGGSDPPPGLVSMVLTVNGSSVLQEQQVVQLTATGVLADGSKKDISKAVTWASSVEEVAVVDSSGLVTAKAAGTTAITASSGSIKSAAATINVTAPVPPTQPPPQPTVTSLTITPATATLPVGTSQQFTVTALYSDSSSADVTAAATWTASANVQVNSTGKVTAASPGAATVTASFQGATGTVQITVTSATPTDPPTQATVTSLTITPATATLPVGTSQQFTVKALYSDSSSADVTAAATWTASANVQVNSTGKVTAASPGAATVTASFQGATGTVQITVTSATPTQPPPTITSLSITPGTVTLPAGTTQQFTATAGYSDGSKSEVTVAATWTCSANIQVDSNGKVTAATPGAATVTASFQGVTGTAQITVTSAKLTALSLDPPQQTIAAGTGCRFTATGLFSDGSSRDVTSQASWGSSDSGIAVSLGTGFEGSFTGKSAGSVQVTAALGGVQAAATLVVTQAQLVAISITPELPTLPVGNSVTFSAVGTFSDGSTQQLSGVTWGTSEPTVASITGSGTAVALRAGSTVISAVFGSVRGNTTLTVTPAYLVQVSVTPATQSLPAGTSLQFTATGTYSDGSVRDLTATATWSSSAAQVAGVGNGGELAGTVSALAVGSATISASMPVNTPAPGSLVGSATVTVTAATLVSLAVTPASFTLPIATTRTVTATGTYSDGSTLDLTRLVTWTSSTPTVAAVSNASGTIGKVTPLTTGSTTITAALGGKSATASVTVTPLNIMNLQGTWVGTYTIYDDPENPAEIGTYAFTLVLSQSGSTVTASPTLRGTTSGSGTLIGAVSDTGFRFVFTYISPRNGDLMTDTALAQVEGETMIGDVVEDYIKGYNCRYSLTLTRQQ